MKHKRSVRAKIISLRTYQRPLNHNGTRFETWGNTVDRVIEHQKWLWERAQGNNPLKDHQLNELGDLRRLMISHKALMSGRTLWLGGTPVSKRHEATQFNCSFLRIETVHDVVDAYWLLLQGCGVGFEPVVGTLSGFSFPVDLEIIRSEKTDPEDKGFPDNIETFSQSDGTNALTSEWYIRVGDSAQAWAKLVGKLLANKRRCRKLTIDFREIRAPGGRLASYGWISSGDEQIAKHIADIVKILNLKAAKLLSRIDIMDIMNHIGATLSSRRSAEIALVPYGDPEWKEFAWAKKDYWINNPQRSQSNNSLVFYHKPSKDQLREIFDIMIQGGGSEPGFFNGKTAKLRAPWFKGTNPCGEILLGNKSFCNLTTLDLGKYNGYFDQLLKDIRIIARANYRQTCVNLRDGILQSTWHELNEFLRLCGVNVTGIVSWEFHDHPLKIRMLKEAAVLSAYSMADELGLPRPKAVTTVQPSGTLSKIMDTTWGIHKPQGRYIFNHVKFSKHDPIVKECERAGYRCYECPGSSDAVLVVFPAEYPGIDFEVVERNGQTYYVNTETAITQLRRYKLWMENYVEHNVSVTISYSYDEVPDIIDWIYDNWNSFVGVSFLLRQDPLMTADDLGHPYLPLEVVSKETFDTYVSELKGVTFKFVGSLDEIEDDLCTTGQCPIR